MRDRERIDPILSKLGQVWHENPDLRLTQLLVALAATGETMPGFFYTEDDRLEAAIDAAVEGGLGQ
ncbi:hypothetical protein Br6_04816 [Rhodococcus sp. Br-6]|nr:hypothetical protein Br6_04816 [Rhodococcus sp. Br-6]